MLIYFYKNYDTNCVQQLYNDCYRLTEVNDMFNETRPLDLFWPPPSTINPRQEINDSLFGANMKLYFAEIKSSFLYLKFCVYFII